MNLKELNTSKFLVDPNDKHFVSKMIALSHEFDFYISTVDKKKALRYLVLVYDKESYFRKDVKNFLQRKYEAGLAAGFTVNEDGKFSKATEGLMVGENDDFNKAVVKYLSLQYNIEFVKLVVYDFNYYKLYIESTKTWNKDIKELMDKMVTEMRNLEKFLYGGEEVQNMRKALYEFSDKAKLDLTPEAIAEKFALDGLKDFSTWGNYDLSKISVNFVGDSLKT